MTRETNTYRRMTSVSGGEWASEMRGKWNTCNSPLQTSRSRCPLSSRLVQTRSPAGCQSCSGCWSRATSAAVCSNSTVSQSLLLCWLSVGSTPGTSVGWAEWPEWAATASCCPYACHRRPHLSWIPCTHTDTQQRFQAHKAQNGRFRSPIKVSIVNSAVCAQNLRAKSELRSNSLHTFS